MRSVQTHAPDHALRLVRHELDAVPGKHLAVLLLSSAGFIQPKVVHVNVMHKLAAHPQPVPLEADRLIARVEVLVRIPVEIITKKHCGKNTVRPHVTWNIWTGRPSLKMPVLKSSSAYCPLVVVPSGKTTTGPWPQPTCVTRFCIISTEEARSFES